MRKLKRTLHGMIVVAIAAYLRRCGGASHVFPYGPDGRYVALMTEKEYHWHRNMPQWYYLTQCQECAGQDMPTKAARYCAHCGKPFSRTEEQTVTAIHLSHFK